MKLVSLNKVRDGKYLKNYELIYENRAGKEKKYEIVSRHEIPDVSHLGNIVSGISIVAIHEGKLLLLKEFRMGINKSIYNLCAGMIEEGETMEECISRELYEETGLHVKQIKTILNPSFASVAISDVMTQIAFVEAEGEITDAHLSVNEKIQAAFYSCEEVNKLLKTEEFSSRAQLCAYFFSLGYIK